MTFLCKHTIMAEGGASDPVDFYFLEGLFLNQVPEKYSCPICLSPAQREAFLTQCCGNHFCLQCISRSVRAGKPCPMCKSSPLVIFPNKERQREVNLLQVHCPAKLKKGKVLETTYRNHCNSSARKKKIPNGCGTLVCYCFLKN